MISIASQNGHTVYGLKEYIISTIDELDNLPIYDTVGSTAFCIATATVYMFDGTKWEEIK